jgi:hypothetical protein
METVKLSSGLIEFLDKSSTSNFLISARQFIVLLETNNLANEEFYKKSHSALVDLYTCGYKLEEIELKYSSERTDFDRDKLFEDKNAGQISELGSKAFYWEVFDPAYDNEKEPSQGWLVDDFSDIYRDLKIELTKIDTIGTDEAIEDAFWQMKWSFLNHWGRHCICALRALHYLNYG